ncbi:MAG: hypothetical protein J6Y62_00150 [Clostridia bacterium]|nr:hypothetical protein [Clostridia bacterium]
MDEKTKAFMEELDNYLPRTRYAKSVRWLEERGFVFRGDRWTVENKGDKVGYKLTVECLENYGLFVVGEKTAQPYWWIKIYKLERNAAPPISDGKWTGDLFSDFQFSGPVEEGFKAVWDNVKKVVDAMRDEKTAMRRIKDWQA